MTVCSDEQVLLSTSFGDIVILVDRRAPKSSAAFLDYVDDGRLAQACFVRVVSADTDHGEPPIAIVQADINPGEGSHQLVPHEGTDQTSLRHLDGTVSMGRTSQGAGSPAWFFICVGDQPGLDQGGARHPDGLGCSAFGRVIAGMDVVRTIHRGKADAPVCDPYFEGQMLSEPVPVLEARRLSTSRAML
jgi:peptidyl-prolyl cis-trans isomerase A (cyclophilin A)